MGIQFAKYNSKGICDICKREVPTLDIDIEFLNEGDLEYYSGHICKECFLINYENGESMCND